MPFLNMLKGEGRGLIEAIDGDRTVMGRHPNCEIVLEEHAVSRQHAQIVRRDAQYFLEDLGSRNETLLNGRKVTKPVPLQDGDIIRICQVVFQYTNDHPKVRARRVDHGNGTDEMLDLSAVDDFGDRHESGMSSIVTTLDVATGSSWRLNVKPEAKLRAVLEISAALGSTLDQEQVLAKLLDGLFRIFPQADEGFVLIKENDSERMRVVATKSRALGNEERSQRVSMTVVKRAMETGQAILSDDAVEDSRFSSSDSMIDLRIRSMMCVPLVSKSGTRWGVIQIDTQERKSKFSQADLDVLTSVASQATLTIENARLHDALMKKRELERELEFAKQVQSGFLPDSCPDVEGFEFADYYEAAQSVGGDFFDYVSLPDGRVAVLIGDVAGKGVSAALLSARLYSAARYHVLTNESVSKALSCLNAEMSTSGLGHRFVTFLIAMFDTRKSEITTANAGHLPLLVHRNNGTLEVVDKSKSGLPLGIIPEQEFEEVKLSFGVGDACVAYTDGITEAMNQQKNLYGSERLEQFLKRPVQGARKMVDALIADVDAFSEGHKQADDICVVGVYRRE